MFNRHKNVLENNKNIWNIKVLSGVCYLVSFCVPAESKIQHVRTRNEEKILKNMRKIKGRKEIVFKFK